MQQVNENSKDRSRKNQVGRIFYTEQICKNFQPISPEGKNNEDNGARYPGN
jgi:hypothetical protein